MHGTINGHGDSAMREVAMSARDELASVVLVAVCLLVILSAALVMPAGW